MVLLVLTTAAGEGSAQTLEWYLRFGSPVFDDAWSVSADATGVYVAGRVDGALPGQTAGFDQDAYLRKYSHDGTLSWTRQFQLTATQPSIDGAWAVVAADAGIFVSGEAECVSGCSSAGFVTRFDHAGDRGWTHAFTQMHTTTSVAVRGSGIFAAGTRLGVSDTAVLARLDLDGNLVWARDVGGGMRIDRIAVDDQGIYAVGSLGSASVRIFDLNGNETGRIGDGSQRYRAVGVDASGLYLAGGRPPSAGVRLEKYRRSGELVWRREQALVPVDLELNPGGLVVLYDTGETATVAHYLRNGSFIWQGQFGEGLGSRELAVAQGAVFVAGSAFGADEDATDSFLAGLSPGFPARLVGLGTLLGAPAMAVLTSDPNQSAIVDIRDAATGALMNRIPLEPIYHPQDLVLVPDFDGNSFPELGILTVIDTPGGMRSGAMRAWVRDTVTGGTVGRAADFPVLQPVKLLMIPDAEDGVPALGVFGFSQVNRVMGVHVREARSGAPLETVTFGVWDGSQEYAVVLPGASRTGDATLAVAQFGDDVSPVVIREALTGKPTGAYRAPRSHTTLHAVAVQNLNGIPGSELAVLERGNIHGGIRAVIRDGRTGGRIKEIYFIREGQASTLIELDDLNGNGTREIGLLSAGAVTDLLEIKDLDTREAISRVRFWHQGYETRGIDVLPDVNGNGSQEVAQLQEKNGRLSVLVKDAVTGEAIRRVYF
jgi:outer membrane protein assembly factor BamB